MSQVLVRLKKIDYTLISSVLSIGLLIVFHSIHWLLLPLLTTTVMDHHMDMQPMSGMNHMNSGVEATTSSFWMMLLMTAIWIVSLWSIWSGVRQLITAHQQEKSTHRMNHICTLLSIISLVVACYSIGMMIF